MGNRQGFWIRQEIMDIKGLDLNGKALLAEIEQLSKLEKGCYVSNHTLAELFSLTERTISRRISELKQLGYITTKEVGKHNNSSLRMIYMTSKLYDEGRQNVYGGVDKNDKGGRTKCLTNSSFPLKGEIEHKKNGKQTPPSRGSVSDKTKLLTPKFKFIEGNLLLVLEEKVGDKATLIFANMNVDNELLPTKEDMSYAIKEWDKKDLIDLYAYGRV
jgi:biotin operon repressor